jgi:hypothetical protein
MAVRRVIAAVLIVVLCGGFWPQPSKAQDVAGPLREFHLPTRALEVYASVSVDDRRSFDTWLDSHGPGSGEFTPGFEISRKLAGHYAVYTSRFGGMSYWFGPFKSKTEAEDGVRKLNGLIGRLSQAPAAEAARATGLLAYYHRSRKAFSIQWRWGFCSLVSPAIRIPAWVA